MSAAIAAPDKNSGGGQNAIIQVESSMVYEAPDFDAPLISEIKGGQKVRISTKMFGRALGARFYMVKLAGRKPGYIATIDVVTETARARQVTQARKDRRRAEKKQKDWDKDTDRLNKPDTTLFDARYIGAFLGVWNYRQKMGASTQQDGLSFYGLKFTVPLRGQSQLEANWGFHFGAPRFFQAVSLKKPSGFLTDLDLLLINPLLKGEHWMGYLGLGPLLHYRSITTSGAAGSVTSANFRVGASFSLGAAYQWQRFCARLEGKYMWEHTGQTAVLLALQTSF